MRCNKFCSGKFCTFLIFFAILLVVTTACHKEDIKPPADKTYHVTTVTTGLHGVMGIDVDENGNIWVTESGTATPDSSGNTHNNNGKVIVITPEGDKYDAIVNLSSFANVITDELQGTSHILLDGGTLYVLSGDYLYQVDISSFKPGDTPIDATTLSYEDVAAVVSQIPTSVNPTHDSHPYNLTIGPDGDIYITDAGANAIVHRKGPNDYVILAEIPAIDNPKFPDLGPPKSQGVPTSIQYDGSDFIVTTLTGFPFPSTKAVIYKVSTSGDVSIYQDGFTMLVDQTAGTPTQRVVVQFSSSFDPVTGFQPGTGFLIQVDGMKQDTLVHNLNMPVGIIQVDENTWYAALLGDGSVIKLAYQ